MEGIQRLERAMLYIRKEMNEQVQAQQIQILLAVANAEGITQHQLSINLGIPPGSISRNVRDMSQYTEMNPQTGNRIARGYNLLETRPDLWERRRMAVFLTVKGKTIMAELNRIIMG